MVAAANMHPFTINKLAAALIALGAILLLLLIAQGLINTVQSRANAAAGDAAAADPVAARRRGIKALVIGADGRASTSKLQAVLWFFAVFYAFAFFFAWGRSTNCSNAKVAGSVPCQQAKAARQTFDNVVNDPLQPAYFVLLGFPLTAAIAAKALTVNKIADGTLTKTSIAGGGAGNGGAGGGDGGGDGAGAAVAADQAGGGAAASPKGVGRAAAEIMTNDQGDTDLIDFQYFGFNLLTLAYFGTQLLGHPNLGLPNLPPTLLALSGVAAATYTTKKALETDVTSSVSRVIADPFVANAATVITVLGTGFGTRPAGNADPSKCQVLVQGQPLQINDWHDNRITAQLTPAAVNAIGNAATAKLIVLDSDGVASPDTTVGVTR